MVSAQSWRSLSLPSSVGGLPSNSVSTKREDERARAHGLLLLLSCAASAEELRAIWRRSRAEGTRNRTRLRYHLRLRGAYGPRHIRHAFRRAPCCCEAALRRYACRKRSGRAVKATATGTAAGQDRRHLQDPASSTGHSAPMERFGVTQAGRERHAVQTCRLQAAPPRPRRMDDEYEDWIAARNEVVVATRHSSGSLAGVLAGLLYNWPRIRMRCPLNTISPPVASATATRPGAEGLRCRWRAR